MKLFEQHFTPRQHMQTSDFELFYYHDDKAMEVGFHHHDFYEIYLFLSGNVTYVIEGKTYKLKPKDILIINNKELHKVVVESGEPYERIVIWISPEYIKSLSSDNTDLLMCFDSSSINRYNLLRLRLDMREQLFDTVEKLGTAFRSSTFGSDILKKVHLTELLIYINRAYKFSSTKDFGLDVTYNDKITEIIQYINHHLDGDITLESLSSKFYLSKYHLLREFKKNTGYTIHKYIQQKRLILAKELLRDCNQVTEVCSKCGFGDYSNFIRSFRKEFGISPKKYCKRI